MKSSVSLLVVLGLIVLMWASASVRYTEPETLETVPALTSSMYDAIQVGMSVEEVLAVVGRQPTERLENARSKFIKLEWQDLDKSAIRVRFKDDKVIEADCTADISLRAIGAF